MSQKTREKRMKKIFERRGRTPIKVTHRKIWEFIEEKKDYGWVIKEIK